MDIRSALLWRRRRHRLALVSASVLAAALAACTRADLATELDRTRSWTATTRLAADRRAAGAINRSVTSHLAKRAGEAVVQERESLAKLATSDSERVAARSALDSLSRALRELQQVGR